MDLSVRIKVSGFIQVSGFKSMDLSVRIKVSELKYKQLSLRI
jgi:hypothetical protein